jgi:hypothetical protein
MAYFFVISTALRDKLVAASTATNVYTPLVTTGGQTVCSHATVLDFPAQFVGHYPRMVELSPTDFPAPAPNPLLPD